MSWTAAVSGVKAAPEEGELASTPAEEAPNEAAIAVEAPDEAAPGRSNGQDLRVKYRGAQQPQMWCEDDLLLFQRRSREREFGW